MNWKELFSRRQDANTIFDFDLLEESGNKAYLRVIAMQIVIDFVARSLAQSDFRVFGDDGKEAKNELSYKLNVRPNPNQSSTKFWQTLVYRLIKNNEVLVIQSDTGDLFLADTWNADSSVLYPTRFSNVSVSNESGGSYTFNRTFSADDVWYLNYSNEKLSRYINDLGKDIGELYDRMLEVQKRNGQIRGVVDTNFTTKPDNEKVEKLQTFIDKIYKSFRSNSIAVVPQTTGLSYTEVSGKQGQQEQSVSELKALQDQLIDTVANMIGVSPALIHGSNEKLESNIKSFLKFCLNPLIKMIQDELNAKVFSKAMYQSGWYVKIFGLNIPNIYESAEAIDKLISASALNANEVRFDFGYGKRAGGDEYVLTKNYEAPKGGEETNDKENSD